MKIRIKLLPLLFTLLTINTFSQILSLKFEVDYSNFNLSDLKDLQNDISADISELIPVENLESFPANYNYELYLLVNDVIPLDFGVFVGYKSTGARTYYSDYSGEFKLDYLASATSFGITLEKKIYDDIIDIIIGTKISISNSVFILDESLSISNEIETNRVEAVANSFSFAPYSAVRYNFSVFSTELKAGYTIDSNSKFHEKNNSDSYLQTSTGNSVETNWSGVFIGIMFGYNIKI